MHADKLIEEVKEVSIMTVRYLHSGNAFQCAVVRDCAFQALRSDGSWTPAQLYSPFLSGMIHCMQLWLILYCFESTEKLDSDSGHLEDLVHVECNQHLVNTTRSSIAELSYWRLMSRTASNDTVTHSVTYLNEEQTIVNHLHLEMNIHE